MILKAIIDDKTKIGYIVGYWKKDKRNNFLINFARVRLGF
jgi:hypothetical protein